MPIHSAMIGTSCSKQVAGTRMNRMVFKAAVEGQLDILRQTQHLKDELTPNKNNILHIHITGGIPRTDCVLEMLEMCPSLLQKKNSKGDTPLHMAAKEGLTEIVKVLVDRVKVQHAADHESGTKLSVKEMVGMINEDGDTVLHEAVRYRRLDVVKLLIREVPVFEYCCNKAGETPIYTAVKRGFDELVDEILKICRSPADFDGPNGLTALHQAIISSYAKVAMGRKILQAMPNLATKTDENGWTPLHYASHFDKVSLAEELLKNDESAAYKADKVGKIPLHIAAGRNHVQIMEIILSYCPDCSEVVDNKRRNVLHLAVKGRSTKAVEHILKYSWGRNLVTETDDDGNTPLHLFAASLSFIDIPTLIMRPVILSSMTEAPLLKGLVQLMFKIPKNAPARLNGEDDKDDKGAKEKESAIKKASKTHLIVAALIVTITYAAGFTLPGGYKEDKGQHRGMAVLAKKASFIAFYITDGTAMILSTIAVFLHFFMTLQEDKVTLIRMFNLASYFTLFAMGAMLAAFAMAACAVLLTSSGTLVTLAAIILSLTFCLFYHVYPLLFKWHLGKMLSLPSFLSTLKSKMLPNA